MSLFRDIFEGGKEYVKFESESGGSFIRTTDFHVSSMCPPGFEVQHTVVESEETICSNDLNSAQWNASLAGRGQAQVENLSPTPFHQAPLCRQFWKAGYYDHLSSEAQVPNKSARECKDSMHVHPKFLHSNATSHKWAFGAIAELFDNAVDEIQNGATFVMMDKISNPKDNSPALLIQDDGGGMDPEAIRRCMNFGFSDKTTKSAIGRYGNGFKASTMRLGADAIVFSRRMDSSKSTQSIGLLSYTYLSRTGLDRIVLPMIDYEYNLPTLSWEPLYHSGAENFQSSMSILLQWSPFSTEAELLKQFDDVGFHGTKVIIYNLWFSESGTVELEFDINPEDICLRDPNESPKLRSRRSISQKHISEQYLYSLRAYLSILYLRLPQNFSMILRGKVVQHHYIARDIRYPEFIVYRPHIGKKERDIIRTVGFVNGNYAFTVHGFNVYHKNRLILPFWRVVSFDGTRGRGVVGVLEANCIEPTHNKQDFERTDLFQRLETRLKEMTWEYWDHHCTLVGYANKRKIRAPLSSLDSLDTKKRGAKKTQRQNDQFSTTEEEDSVVDSTTSTASFTKAQSGNCIPTMQLPPEVVLLLHENKNLRAKCFKHEKTAEQLNQKVSVFKREIDKQLQVYGNILRELLNYQVM